MVLEFLKESSKQPRDVKKSIQDYAKCKALREWIVARSEGMPYIKIHLTTTCLTLDVTAMETFISVVLDTLAEGGDEIQDRLTNLSDLCSKFALLIYQADKMKSNLKIAMKAFENTYKMVADVRDPIALVVSYLIP